MLEALLVAIWAFFCGIDKFDVALCIHRPIITGPVVGLILGDYTLGIVTGATLELAWLGLVPNAGAQPPDVTLGTIAAVSFQIAAQKASGQPISPDTALGVGLPIAVLMQLAVIVFFTLTSFTMAKVDEHANAANPNGIDRYLILTICARGLLYALFGFFTIYFGEHLAEFITNNIPQEWLKGVGIGARMVPAIGFAMLLKTMWSKEMAPIFFIGFVCTTYLKLPITAVAIIAGALAMLYFYFSGNSNSGNASQVEEFEDGI